MSSSLPVSSPSAMGLTLAIAVILLASNFTIINAQQQQQLTSQTGQIENGTTTVTTPFQSTNDSFSLQVPEGWITHDVSNTGSALLEETRLGYVLLAQLCSQEEQEQGAGAFSTNAGGGSTNNSASSNNSCQGAQEEVIHIIRYPDLDTRLLANNITTANNNMTTTDNIVSYQLQKLQEIGYRSMQIVNSVDMTVNLTNPQTSQTVEAMPAKLVEMTYGTNFAPNEIRRGYLVSTATNATAPNLGVIKGYSLFYEVNSTTTNATAAITRISDSLPPPTLVGQVFDSFELMIAPEVTQALAQQAAQAAETTEDTTDNDDDADDDDGDDNGGDDDDGNGGEDASCHSSYPDTCIPPPPPNLNCDDVGASNFQVVGSDPHGFDGDNDGIGCESGSNAPDDSEEEPGGGDDDGEGGDDDDGGGLDDCVIVGGTSRGDDCDTTADDDGGGDDDDGGNGEEPDGGGDNDGADDDDGNGAGGNDDDFDDCVVPPGRDPGDVGC